MFSLCCGNRQLVCFCVMRYCWKYKTLPYDTELQATVISEMRRENLFRPTYGIRARLNIYISKDCTQGLLKRIKNRFNDASQLYYYLDYTTAIHINDKQPWKIRVHAVDNSRESIRNINLQNDNFSDHDTEIILINFDLFIELM